MSKHPHFIISASLGIGIQPTAIAALEQEILKGDRWLPETAVLRLRHLERMPLDATYPDIVARVSTLLETPEIKDGERCGGADVVLDVTGSGRAILELFERAEITPIMVKHLRHTHFHIRGGGGPTARRTHGHVLSIRLRGSRNSALRGPT